MSMSRIEKEKIPPVKYVYGSRGPKEADELCAKNGFNYTGDLVYSSMNNHINHKYQYF